MNALTHEIEKAGKALAISVAREATSVKSLKDFNEKQLQFDPSRLTWPPTLVMELALKTATPRELKEHYGFSDEQWQALRENRLFLKELAEMCDTVKQEGMSFRMKARLQAEGLLETQWRLIHGPMSEVPAAVKQRGIETIFRVAGYDVKQDGNGAVGNNLNIQINLGG